MKVLLCAYAASPKKTLPAVFKLGSADKQLEMHEFCEHTYVHVTCILSQHLKFPIYTMYCVWKRLQASERSDWYNSYDLSEELLNFLRSRLIVMWHLADFLSFKFLSLSLCLYPHRALHSILSWKSRWVTLEWWHFLWSWLVSITHIEIRVGPLTICLLGVLWRTTFSSTDQEKK